MAAHRLRFCFRFHFFFSILCPLLATISVTFATFATFQPLICTEMAQLLPTDVRETREFSYIQGRGQRKFIFRLTDDHYFEYSAYWYSPKFNELDEGDNPFPKFNAIIRLDERSKEASKLDCEVEMTYDGPYAGERYLIRLTSSGCGLGGQSLTTEDFGDNNKVELKFKIIGQEAATPRAMAAGGPVQTKK